MRLLLVEDDAMIGESIEEGLRGEHYAVDWVRDGASADLAVAGFRYDLLVLDLGLPHKQGLEVLRGYRRQGGAAPVLIVSARDGAQTRVEALDAGADDYLIKPFDLDELLARIRALLRRGVARTSAIARHGALSLNLATHQALWHGAALPLSAREFAVLRALLDSPGAIVSRSQLEDKLYSWNEEIESNAIDVYIYHLRKKLGVDFIKNVRGVGYKLAAPP